MLNKLQKFILLFAKFAFCDCKGCIAGVAVVNHAKIKYRKSVSRPFSVCVSRKCVDSPAAFRSSRKSVKTGTFTAMKSAFFFNKKSHIHFCLNFTAADFFFYLIDNQIADSGRFFCTFNFVFIFYHSKLNCKLMNAFVTAADFPFVKLIYKFQKLRI